MVVLMTIVTLSVSAQCPTAVRKPLFYGDYTPCKNQKNVVYTLSDALPGQPITWTWCRGIVGQAPTSAGFVPSEFRWKSPSMTTISDGITTVSSSTGNWLYTTKTAVAVTYKGRGGVLSCEFKDSCGVWQYLYDHDIFVSCDPSTYTVLGITPVIDTGKTLINARVIHATYDMSITFDSVAGLKKPYTYIMMYQKYPNASCSDYIVGGWSIKSDGYYSPIRQTFSPSLPFVVAYGWSWYYATASSPARTFRLQGVDGDGKAFETLPFTIATNYYTNILYPVLPAP